MSEYTSLSREELLSELDKVRRQYQEYQTMGLKLNMARGKPGLEQLALSTGMLSVIGGSDDILSEDGTDCRNYGDLEGIPEARRLMGSLCGEDASHVIVCGNSSLNMMYGLLSDAFLYGIQGHTPWSQLSHLKFLCPVPGYDRHFRITQRLGFEMISIPMKEDGPDMEMVRHYAESDPSVKGIWCVPQYSNPDGITYSDETVRAFARLKPAAPDFRIMWDNAYLVHHFDWEHQDHVLNIFDACRKEGSEDMVYEFISTSKITFPGSGISAVIASPANITEIKGHLSGETIGYDKMNMLRHVLFFKDAQGVYDHMKKHADIIRPRFELVWRYLEPLQGLGIAHWTKPHGGYFFSLYTLPTCAARTVALCKEAGVTLTGAGAAFPYGKDPEDSHIRIAPTYPSLADLEKASQVLVCSVKLAALEKLTA